MFRIIVISLFVANILLAGFEASKPSIDSKTTTGPVKALDPNIPTIHLFSELMENRDLMSGNRQCFSLGPFHDLEDMNEVQARLQPTSISIDDRQTLAMVEKGYWVFLRPYRNLLEANEVLFALQGLGLKDIAVIYDGERKNAISLGYFLRQENALNRKKALNSNGYQALVRVQRQSEPRYWLDFEQNPGSDLIAIDMQNRPNDFMQRALPCPDLIQTEAVANLAAPVDAAESQNEAVVIEEQEETRSDQG